jgi:putative DNA primase/helicase
MIDKFKKANSCITERLIRQYFDCEKSKVISTKRGPELMTLCPFRQDTKPGSFFINLNTGMWIEQSTAAGESKGDLIKLVSLAYNLPLKDAAEKIIKDSGGIMPEDKKKSTQKEKKYKPVIPIPEDALNKLNDHINGDWIRKEYGEPKDGTEYRDKNNNVWMCVVRHVKDGDKNDVPYCYNDDGKWHAGNPLKKDRPLLGIDKLTGGNPVLIVEGEKCQKVKVENYDLLTWSGGTNQISKSDWRQLLKCKSVIIWPDCDHKKDKRGIEFPREQQPGLKAAIYIKSILSQAKILDIYQKDHSDGWDIYDAKEEGIDLKKFIENTPEYMPPEPQKENIDIDIFPFKFLGFDDGRHYFIPKGSNIVKKIPFGQFSKSKLLELAPLSFWCMEFPIKTGFNIDSATDFIIRESESKGFFMPDNVRGAGVWYDDGKIIVNNGQTLQDCENNKLEMSQSKYHYVMSDKKMGNLTGNVSTIEEGKNLIDLFLVQGFETNLEAFSVLGWSLIAPFGGILKWRPHLWITGPIQTGKSFLLENLIHPLTGPFSFVGSGKDSAAGLYRTLWKDPCPVIKDEMEPGRDRDTRKRIDEVLETARNASSDFSAYKTISNQHGGVDRFCIRSMFCFSSVVPYFTGDAIESRVLICRLKNLARAKDKKKKTIEIMNTGIYSDPGKFRRKIFKNLKNIIQSIEILKGIIKDVLHDDRKADNFAPLFAAFFSLIHDEIIEKKKIADYLADILSQLETSDDESDEDKLLKSIFDYHIKLDNTKVVSIAELILYSSDIMTVEEDKTATLNRHGIKIYEFKDKVVYLAIARNHSQLKKILTDTIYSGRYEEVLKRHDFAISDQPSVRFAGTSTRAILLDWDKVKSKYFEDPDAKIDSSEDLLNIL